MSSRPLQFWNGVVGAGITCLVLSLVTLVGAVWRTARSEPDKVTVSFEAAMIIFAVLAIAGTLAIIVADRRIRSRRGALPHATGRMVPIDDAGEDTTSTGNDGTSNDGTSPDTA